MGTAVMAQGATVMVFSPMMVRREASEGTGGGWSESSATTLPIGVMSCGESRSAVRGAQGSSTKTLPWKGTQLAARERACQTQELIIQLNRVANHLCARSKHMMTPTISYLKYAVKTNVVNQTVGLICTLKSSSRQYKQTMLGY